MVISSDKIRSIIEQAFDMGKGIFSEKLYKTNAIKDKAFYSPTKRDFFSDYIEVKNETAKYFNMDQGDIKLLASNPDTIWDCDNMARELRHALNRLHYKRLLNKEHKIPFEYAAFHVTDVRKTIFNSKEENLHDFVMVFTQEGICFGDLMMDKVWDIKDFKPNLIDIGG